MKIPECPICRSASGVKPVTAVDISGIGIGIKLIFLCERCNEIFGNYLE
jgi:hypothetical protein